MPEEYLSAAGNGAQQWGVCSGLHESDLIPPGLEVTQLGWR